MLKVTLRKVQFGTVDKYQWFKIKYIYLIEDKLNWQKDKPHHNVGYG